MISYLLLVLICRRASGIRTAYNCKYGPALGTTLDSLGIGDTEAFSYFYFLLSLERLFLLKCCSLYTEVQPQVASCNFRGDTPKLFSRSPRRERQMSLDSEDFLNELRDTQQHRLFLEVCTNLFLLDPKGRCASYRHHMRDTHKLSRK